MSLFHAAFKKAAVANHLRRHGVTEFEFEAGKAASAALDNQFKRQVAFLGDMAMLKAGAASHPYRLLLNGLWKEANWCPQFDRFIEPVLDACTATKSANLTSGVAGSLSNAVSGARDGSLGLLGALLLMSGAGGASLGALNWHLARGTQEGDAQNETLRASIDELRQARNEIAMS